MVGIVMNRDRPLESFMLASRAKRLRAAVARRTRTLTVVLDGVHDPHNLSAVLRSCEGFGVLDVHVVESHAPFRLSRKISQGTEKWLDVHTHPDPVACVRALGRSGHRIWIADPCPECVHLDQLPYSEPLALVFGNEHDGASEAMAGAAQGRFHIPMWGFAQSLNVSVAAGVTLAAAVRHREARAEGHADLPPGEQAALVAEWQRRSVQHADAILTRLHAEAERKGRMP